TSADLLFHVPMHHDITVDDVGISVKARVAGFAIPIGSQTRLSGSLLNIDVDNDHLDASGTADLADSKIDFDWTEAFKTTDPATTHIALKGVLTDAARTRLGLDTDEYLKGPMGVSGTVTGHRGTLAQADLSLDLTPSIIDVDLIGVSKTAGVPVNAHLG